MSRLASFQGPSTPSKSPVNVVDQTTSPLSPSSKGKRTNNKSKRDPKPTLSPEPVTPSKRGHVPAIGSPIRVSEKNDSAPLISSHDVPTVTETNVHKRLRQILFDIRSASKRWDELIRLEGFKAAKEMVDARTLIE